MFLSCRRLHQFSVHTIDHKHGTLEEIYVDISKWVVRYFYAALQDQKSVKFALISPISVTSQNPNSKIVYVNLSYRQLWNSPTIDFHKPITREIETRINEYYCLSAYWPGAGNWGATDSPRSLQNAKLQETLITPDSPVEADTSLVTFTRLSSRHLENPERRIGRIADLMINENSWKVGYLVIDENEQQIKNRFLLEPADILHVDRLSAD